MRWQSREVEQEEGKGGRKTAEETVAGQVMSCLERCPREEPGASLGR